MEIDQQVFAQQRRPRFGNANPERMRVAFWEWMIRGDENTPAEAENGIASLGLVMRDGKIKSGYGPYRTRDLFKVPLNREDGPIWTFDRMGATRCNLTDGRILYIGGEHEDSYDPDFCVYNDLIVFGPAGQLEIYGYPQEVFPPTDFHTATLVNDRIIIIGRLGYQNARQPGHTPVYALNVSNYHIIELQTKGENPGWIFKHMAELDRDGMINIRGGELIEKNGDKQKYRRSSENYSLDVKSWTWLRTTNRNWLQFSIRQENGGLFVLDKRPEPQTLLPRTIKHAVAPCEEWNGARIVIDGIPVSLSVGVSCIDVVVEGNLPSEKSDRLAEEVRINAEAIVGNRCVVE
jgi:hypothetical protein